MVSMRWIKISTRSIVSTRSFGYVFQAMEGFQDCRSRQGDSMERAGTSRGNDSKHVLQETNDHLPDRGSDLGIQRDTRLGLKERPLLSTTTIILQLESLPEKPTCIGDPILCFFRKFCNQRGGNHYYLAPCRCCIVV
jgi:hypothetical protein